VGDEVRLRPCRFAGFTVVIRCAEISPDHARCSFRQRWHVQAQDHGRYAKSHGEHR
jgi:hypothetical protein